MSNLGERRLSSRAAGARVATLLCCLRYRCPGAADGSISPTRGSCRIRNEACNNHIWSIWLDFCMPCFFDFLLHEGHIKIVLETFYQVSIIYIVPSIVHFYLHESLATSVVSTSFKKSIIIPVPKNNKPSCLMTIVQWPSQSIVMKVFERLVKSHIAPPSLLLWTLFSLLIAPIDHWWCHLLTFSTPPSHTLIAAMGTMQDCYS